MLLRRSFPAVVTQALAGALVAGVIAAWAHRVRALSLSGAVTAACFGTIAAGAGLDWALMLLAFFLAAAAISRYRAREKTRRSECVVEKRGARDAAQVAANGGVYAAAAVGFVLTQHPVWMLVGAGALAASSADTWATEIGLLSSAAPRSVVSRRVVPPGTSGGVTYGGTLAGVVGAVAIGCMALSVGWGPRAAAAAMAAGIAGMMLDSLIGATIQERRWCPRCETTTERRVHDCGTPTTGHGGVGWMRNDAVNVVTSLAGGIVGATIGRV